MNSTIRTLILNEVRHSLLSMRFFAGLAFVILVYSGSSVVFGVRYLQEQEKDAQNQGLYQAQLDAGLGGLEELYTGSFTLVKKQEMSGYLAAGGESRIPKAMVVSPEAPQGASSSGGMLVGTAGRNYKLENYADFDLTFIVGIVLSFLVVVLSFDAISRDREEGTLKQQLANSTGRVEILLGKYGAVLILLGIITLIGTLLSVIILQVMTDSNPFFSTPLESFSGTIIAILYLSVFIWLSLWISSSVSKSAMGLALLLLVWTGLVVLSPYIGGMLAQKFFPVRSQTEHSERFSALIHAENLPPEAIAFFQGTGKDDTWSLVEQYFDRQADRFEGFVVDRFNELTGQAQAAEMFNFFTPYEAFKQAMQHLANTGLEYHTDFFQSARRYRTELVGFIREQDRSDPESRHRIASIPNLRSMSHKPVDPSIVPRFVAPSRHANATDILAALPAAGYLAALNVLFFLLGLRRFLRMDVR